MTEFTLTLATKTLTVVRAISQIMEVPDPNEVARAIAAAEATAAGVANPLDGFAGGAGAFALFCEGPAAESSPKVPGFSTSPSWSPSRPAANPYGPTSGGCVNRFAGGLPSAGSPAASVGCRGPFATASTTS